MLKSYDDTMNVTVSGGGTSTLNAMNLLIGVKNDYSGWYMVLADDLDHVCVQIPNGTYIKYTSLSGAANNSEILKLEDKSIVTNSSLLAIRKSGSAYDWYVVNEDMTLSGDTGSSSIHGTTVGGKLVTKILADFADATSIDEIVCRSKNICFVKGSVGSSKVWKYIRNTETNASQLDLSFIDSGISWIDSRSKDVLDAYESGRTDIMYCTTAGLWKSKYKQSCSFDGNLVSKTLAVGAASSISDAKLSSPIGY